MRRIQDDQRTRFRPPAARRAAICLVAATALLAGAVPGAELLEGEFGNVDLGRPLIEPARFPTIGELRRLVARPEITTVLMFKLFAGGDNHHLPVWSEDGLRLAFQQSDGRASSSKLFVFSSLDRREPTPLTDQPGAYDYMLRWAVNQPLALAFARIDPARQTTRIYLADDGSAPRAITANEGRHVFPALYRRTDGIWRLVYEADGRLMHEAWDDEGPVDRPAALARGTSARWSRDGYRLLFALERYRQGKLVAYDVALRNLRTEVNRLLPAGEEGVVRSPTWSPDERYAAYYVRSPGDDRPWRIRLCPTGEEGTARTVGGDVVVNRDFESEGPAWEPSGRRVWFFSNEHRQQAYHPLVAADVASGELLVVDYPRRCTTPNDLAINPATLVPEMAFVAHDGLPRDLFLLMLNHY